MGRARHFRIIGLLARKIDLLALITARRKKNRLGGGEEPRLSDERESLVRRFHAAQDAAEMTR